jgi:hypothetical protein
MVVVDETIERDTRKTRCSALRILSVTLFSAHSLQQGPPPASSELEVLQGSCRGIGLVCHITRLAFIPDIAPLIGIIA